MTPGQRLSDLDAVTIDAYGTLLELDDPVGRLGEALRSHGVERSSELVAAAFSAEVEHYAAAKRTIVDLDELWRECASVFLEAASAEIEAQLFVPAFSRAYVFRPIPGAIATLDRLASRGLPLGLVANWDASLRQILASHDLERRFASIVISGETRVWKPDPEPFRLALAELGVPPERALHVGDDSADEEGASAAGVHFAPAPLADLLRTWT